MLVSKRCCRRHSEQNILQDGGCRYEGCKDGIGEGGVSALDQKRKKIKTKLKKRNLYGVLVVGDFGKISSDVAYSAGVSRRLSEEAVGGRDGTITSLSAYWLGPYLLYMLLPPFSLSLSSTTNTASSAPPAESSPPVADRLGGGCWPGFPWTMQLIATAAAPTQNK